MQHSLKEVDVDGLDRNLGENLQIMSGNTPNHRSTSSESDYWNSYNKEVAKSDHPLQ